MVSLSTYGAHWCRKSIFEDALAAEPERLSQMPESWYGYCKDGLYADQLSVWFSAFDRSSFYIGTLDELASNPYSFLGVFSDYQPKLSLQNEARAMRGHLLKELYSNIPGKNLAKSILPSHLSFQTRNLLLTWKTKPIEHKVDPPQNVIES